MKQWFAKKPAQGWTAVALEADGICGVTVVEPQTEGGRPCVVKCGFIPGVVDSATIAKLAEKIAVPGCPWTLSLFRKTYNILVVPEPTVQADELEKSVRWSVGNMVDYPMEEACMASMHIPTAEQLPNRPSNLYVAVVKKEVIAGYNAIFQQAGFPLEAIDVRETALRNIAVLAGASEKGLGLLSIGKLGVQFIIAFKGALYLDRFVEESMFGNGNASHDPDAEARAYERIALQVHRSLDFIGRTLTFINIDRVLMAPMPGKLAQIDLISQQLPVPTESLDLATVFDFSKTPELAKEENQALYLSALGAALRFRNSSEQINMQVRQERTGLSLVWMELAAMVLIVVSLLGTWGMREVDVLKARDAERAGTLQLRDAKARSQIAAQPSEEDVAAEIAALKARAEAAQRILLQSGSLGSQTGYADYFSMLASVGEDGLWLNSVKVDNAGRTVRLSGIALQKESVLHYAQQVNALFSSNGVQFTTVELTPEAAGKPTLAATAFVLY